MPASPGPFFVWFPIWFGSLTRRTSLQTHCACMQLAHSGTRLCSDFRNILFRCTSPASQSVRICGSTMTCRVIYRQNSRVVVCVCLFDTPWRQQRCVTHRLGPPIVLATGVRIVQNGRSTGRADGLTNLNKSMQYVLINCLRATLNGHLVGIEINDVKNPIQPTHISATGKFAPGPKVKYINRADSVPYVRSTTSPYLIRVLGGRFFVVGVYLFIVSGVPHQIRVMDIRRAMNETAQTSKSQSGRVHVRVRVCVFDVWVALVHCLVFCCEVRCAVLFLNWPCVDITTSDHH